MAVTPDPEQGNGAAWPDELAGAFANAVTAEFAGLTRMGAPVTVPTTPYVGDATLDLCTGLTYPTKAERARRNPKVALLFGDPVGSPLVRPPVVAVQGLAAVRDRDLQANADRYVRDSQAKLPGATKGQPRFVLRKMAWYYARIWVEITPVRVLWWPDRDLAAEPREWTKPGEIVAPASDPSPAGRPPPAWTDPPSSWREEASYALASLPWCDVTVVDGDGYPLCLPVARVEADPAGFVLHVGAGAPPLTGGPACVTFHDHADTFTGQENRTFVGRLSPDDGTFVVERALAHWSLAGGRPGVAKEFLASGWRLRGRLRAEAARRGQPVPTVRFPGEY
ncbi:MAG TPA: hypothetical protein VHZ02_07255 [Acidimicrobiales bacterium]|nr:hypothetical protein [Acidimicrobiales bacterium]